MTDHQTLNIRLEELAHREWDEPAIQARVRDLSQNGIQKKALDPHELLASKDEILDRVQLRAEEYNYLLKNCAQGTALALMEEFGLGSMEIVKALTPFPGIGGTGEICGGISGSLIVFGLFFGSEDRLDYRAVNDTMTWAQKFMAQFEERIGHRRCADIIENVILSRRLNPGDSEEAMHTFASEKGFEKCSLLPGMGARLAAEFIIDSMQPR